MTLATTTPRTSVTGTNAVITVPVDFQFFGADELVVIERTIATGAEAEKTRGTDYTVSGGDGATGSVTSIAAVASTLEWHVRRATGRAQSTDYPTAGTFPAESHEEALDRVAAAVQELDASIAQCLRFPRSDAAVRVAQLVSSVARANKVLSFDANGDVTVTDLSASIATTTLLVVSAVDPGHSTGRLWVDSSVANTLIVKQSDGADWIETWRIDTTTNQVTLANTPTFSGANVFTGVNTIRSTDGAAGEIVALDLDRASGTPAASDLLMALRWLMRDGGGGTDVAAKLLAKLLDPTAGSEDAELQIFTVVAGTLAARLIVGQGLYTPAATGGDRGANSGNFGSLFVNNVTVIADIDGLTTTDNPANAAFVAGSIAAGTNRKFRVGEVGGWAVLEEKVAAASTSLDFVLTPYLTDFEDFEFFINNLVPATNGVELLVRTSTDGGSTFDAGITDYNWMVHGTDEDNISLAEASPGATSMQLNGAATISNIAGDGVAGRVLLYAPATSTAAVKLTWSLTYADGADWNTVEGGGNRQAAADVDAIRFLASAGNLTSGKIVLLGRRKVT